MKQFKLQALIISLIFITATTTHAQNFWETSQPKNGTTTADTDCPFYNADDPEINIEWQYALGEEGYNNYAMDIEFTPDSNLVYLYYSSLYQANYLVCVKQNRTELWRTQIMVNDTISYGKKINWVGDYIYVSGSWDIENTRYFGVTKLDINGKVLWFKQLFSNKTNLKKIREYNPYLINVENNNFLGSFVDNDELFVAKFDSSFNMSWRKTLSELGVNEKMYVLNIACDFINYYVFSSTHDTCYYFQLNIDGELVTNGKLPDKHFNSSLERDNFYFTGYNDDKIDFVRKYSNTFELKVEFNSSDPSNQHKIYDASDIDLLKDQSIMVFYDYEYLGDMQGNTHSNFQVLHIDKQGECLSTLNLYATGSQYSKKMLITNSGDCILFGYGYNSYYNCDMVALGKVNRWDPLSIKNKDINDIEIKIFPNPSNNQLNIEFDKVYSGTLKIITLNGTVLHESTIANQIQVSKNIYYLNAGIYIIQFTSKGKYVVQKLVKL